MPFTAPGSAAQVPTSPFSSAPTNCHRAVLDSASRRHWAARWRAIVSGAAGYDCGAVARNRIRRRLREMVRCHRQEIPAGWDIVVHPKSSAAKAPFVALTADLLRL